MEIQVLETLLLPLLNEKSDSSEGKANQKPSLWPHSVLGNKGRLREQRQIFRF